MNVKNSGRSLPQGLRIYAVGDIHGRLSLLKRLQAMIHADIATGEPPREIQIVYLGDYIDRGPDSRAVVDALIRHGQDDGLENTQAVFLKGNHEHALLQFVAGKMRYADWLRWGGDTTLLSYGVRLVPPYATENDIEGVRQSFMSGIPESHSRFFGGLAMRHEAGDYVFVHAGVRPGVALDAQDPDDLLMIREDFLDRPVTCGKTVVHGHTIFDTPLVRKGKAGVDSIGVDTGAYRSDILTAVVLENDDCRFIHT